MRRLAYSLAAFRWLLQESVTLNNPTTAKKGKQGSSGGNPGGCGRKEKSR
jgi:hypothetical protein